MITAILGLLGSPIIGSVIGFFSSWLMKKEQRKDKELDYSHEREMSKLNHSQTIERSKVEGELAVQKQDAVSFTTALESENLRSGNKFLDGLKALIRPVITIYLLSAISYIAYKVSALIGGFNALDPNELVLLYKEIIHQVLYLTSVCVSFWFGIRPKHTK